MSYDISTFIRDCDVHGLANFACLLFRSSDHSTSVR
jgi:hypothetical protein